MLEFVPRNFTLEDARKLAILRAYIVIIERNAGNLLVSDKDGVRFPQLVDALRDLLDTIKDLSDEQGAANLQSRGNTGECWPDYELCNDGICRAWCS